jgi:DNA-3-methyladenine glycosylase II
MQTFDPAMQYLIAVDDDWARLIADVGDCGLKTNPGREPYEALVRSISYQQLHGRAAEAILGRLLDMYPDQPFPTPSNILATDPALMRACGFSTTKVATIREIAQKTQDGVVPTLADAQLMSNEELIERLVQLKGVGRWTVEMLLIFTLERWDVLPVGDFGVREGYRLLKSLSKQPTPKELSTIGAAWSPYSSIAAWYLWQAASLYKPKPEIVVKKKGS